MKATGDNVAAIEKIVPVSRETEARLATYVELLGRWQGRVSLVAAGAMAEIWQRHIADSAQLVALMPKARKWLDLGSGAGLPGLVVAMVGGEGTHVDLIESNRRKCAFLREAIRVTGAPAAVHENRVESLMAEWCEQVGTPPDMIISRALARLDRLLALAAPLMTAGVPAAFHKGRDFGREIAEATQSWDFDLVQHDSRIGGGGVILEISRLRRKRQQG